MTEAIRHRLNDSPFARWTVLIIVVTAMMMGYFVNDVMSPLETLLELPKSQGGLGWTPSDYGFFSGAGSFINVFLLMLFFSGLILDKMGIRFTGVLACSLMALGTLLKLYGVTTDLGTAEIAIFGFQLPMSVAVASLGFAVFGVGYEMTGITVSKAMVRWFTGHELALAMRKDIHDLMRTWLRDGKYSSSYSVPAEEYSFELLLLFFVTDRLFLEVHSCHSFLDEDYHSCG